MWKFILSLLLAAGCSAQVFSPELIGSLSPATSSFNPSNIPTMLLWLQGDTVSNTDGTTIALWPDISGRGNHFTNETAARRPYVTNNVANGHSAVRFAGSAIDFRWLSNNTGFATGATQAEMFVVVKASASPAAANVDVPWSFKRAGNGESAYPNTAATIQNIFGHNLNVTYTANITNNYKSTTLISNSFQIWNASIRTNEMIGRWNGDVVIGLDFITNTSIGFSNVMSLGRSPDNASTWNGEIAELMLFSNVLAATDRELVYAYLSNRYSISYTNPAIAITPSDFGGLVAWWKVSDIATNDGSPVTNWIDRVSGLQWTNMAVGTTLPIYKSTILNGQPGLQFLGTASNQTMKLASSSIKLTNYAIMIVEAATNSGNPLIGSGSTYQWITRISGQDNFVFRNPAFIQKTFPRPTNQIILDTWIQNQTLSETRMMVNATNAQAGAFLGEMQVDSLMAPFAVTGRSSDNVIGEIVIFNSPSTPMTAEKAAKLYYQYFRGQYLLP